MIHAYRSNGYNIVMDVNSGAVHVVDDVVYDLIELLDGAGAKRTAGYDELRDMLLSGLSGYDEALIKEAYDEVNELITSGMLFTDDEYKDHVIDFTKRKTVVKALCLHVSHDCNLACKYCFAEEGKYHQGKRELMSFEVGKRALDFLVENSGNRHNLEVDFFGGEPLMNFDVVKQLVEYGRSIEDKYDKKFRFTLTTNGVLLNDEILEFANKEMGNLAYKV